MSHGRIVFALFILALCGCGSNRATNAAGLTKEQATERTKEMRVAYLAKVAEAAKVYAAGPDDARDAATAAVADNAADFSGCVKATVECVTWNLSDRTQVPYYRDRVARDLRQSAMDAATHAVVKQRAAAVSAP